MLDFLAAIDSSSRPIADIEQGHISTASCIIANLSMKTGRPIVYDPKKRELVNDMEGNALLQRPYRQPVGASRMYSKTVFKKSKEIC